MKCLECKAELASVTNEHLAECCGLTLQEYAIKHHCSLDLLVNESDVNCMDDVQHYALPSEIAGQRANTIMQALLLTQSFTLEQEYWTLHSDIRRLDELLWYARELNVFGIQYRQDYIYSSSSHRVLAENKLKVPVVYEHKFPSAQQYTLSELYVAVLVAQCGEYLNSYVYLRLPQTPVIEKLIKQLRDDYQIRWMQLDSLDAQDEILYRTVSIQDAQRLLRVIEPELKQIPCVCDRYFADTEEAVVSKELVFDSAHFITDHPGKCENLHGGRYTLNVKVRGSIDPLTGFVIDYGYLKSVVKHRVIKYLDHQNLNYVHADLGWRSSTELINIFIWEQLIDYLPGLEELQTYETTQSYCVYRGPSLEEFQNRTGDSLLKHFSNQKLGQSMLRNFLVSSPQNLKVVKHK